MINLGPCKSLENNGSKSIVADAPGHRNLCPNSGSRQGLISAFAPKTVGNTLTDQRFVQCRQPWSIDNHVQMQRADHKNVAHGEGLP